MVALVERARRLSRVSRISLAVVVLGLIWFAATSYNAKQQEAKAQMSTALAKSIGPLALNPKNLDGLAAYNHSVNLALSGNVGGALSQMQMAVRSRQLQGSAKRDGFANLCLLYWANEEWKEALVACIKAKRLQPKGGDVQTYLAAIKRRQKLGLEN